MSSVDSDTAISVTGRWGSQTRPTLQTIGDAVYWLVPLAVIAALYAPTAVELWRVWDIDPNYSHGPVVVLFSLALVAWIARQREDETAVTVTRAEVCRGLLGCVVGFTLHSAGLFADNLLLDGVGLVLMLLGMFIVLGGTAAGKAYGFPVWFLLFAVPLPVMWYQPVAVILQQAVSFLSAEGLNLVGIPAYREGYTIYLTDLPLEVGEACSGLRQLTAVLALAAALGFLSRRGMWFCWTLLISALPIAVFANCLRIVLTGVVCQTIGRSWAEGVFHELEGLVLVLLSAVLLYGWAGLLGRWVDRLHGPAQTQGAT